MRHRHRASVVGIALLTLTACPGEEQPNTRARLDDSSTLHGTDADSDGLRDDVAAAIEAMDVGPDVKSVLTISARGTEGALDLASDKASARRYAVDIDTSLTCNEQGVNVLEIADQISVVDMFVLNTPERRAAYDEYDSLLSGGDFPQPGCDRGARRAP